MAELMKVHGKIITCMVKVLILGVMGGNMKENIIWIRSMVTVSIIGQMEDDMRAIGVMVNNMEKASTYCQMELLK